MNIAVTTASGQLGSAIIKHLKNLIGTENVIGVARTPSKAEQLGVEIRKGDYNNREEYETALKGMDAVLIVSGMDDPKKRIQQHRNVIEAARSNGLKKIVYTSIVGDPEQTAFSPIIQSNRQTEEDVKSSGLEWVIGRNGLYIEPDLEYIDNYVIENGISNCADKGLCAYTSRSELGFAYAKMLIENIHNGQTYNLVGEAISQERLAELINRVYGTSLKYNSLSVEDYVKERQAALGDFLGTVIGGIYEGIKNGAFNPRPDYESAAGRPHQTALEMIKRYKSENS
jgi:NAD(P)H dehydrogenase (quinone)